MTRVVEGGNEALLEEAVAMAKEWAAQGRVRSLVREGLQTRLSDVNRRESVALARAFMSPPFMAAMHEFHTAKGNLGVARVFWLLMNTKPLWSRL